MEHAFVYIGGACICLYWWSIHLFIFVEHEFVYSGEHVFVYTGGACICLYWWSMNLFILVEHEFVYIGGAYS